MERIGPAVAETWSKNSAFGSGWGVSDCCTERMIGRLGVLHIPYTFRDVQGLLLASDYNVEQWVQGILQCWLSPYEMKDDKAGSLAHTLLIQGCPGSFTWLGIEHWVETTFSFMWHAMDRLLSFCWWKQSLKILGFPLRVWTQAFRAAEKVCELLLLLKYNVGW